MEETRIENQVREERDPVSPLLDCGSASQVTRGVPYQLAFEMGWPPNNRMYYG